ncbi:membrane protein [Paraconexibacter sp. AEG42_29]|uniref:Membrane protein n=1 Tax=Paraconexibacter sp. AEG42_29 TaxID=2997339 RepID=A0AAU7AVV2_9ACTN
MPPIKTFRVPLAMTVIAIVTAAIIGGAEVGAIVALLAVLEISISFDNAIVNAAILKNMSEHWQQIFLTWGILIAVFGMRLVFPILIVAVAAGLSLPTVVDQALNQPDVYAHNLEGANAIIAGFGGIFLLMVFLSFFFDEEKDHHWLPGEGILAKIGSVDGIVPAIAAAALLLISQLVAPAAEQDVLVAGLAGIVAFLVANGLADRLEPEGLDEDDDQPAVAMDAGSSGAAADGPTGSQAAAAAAGVVAKGGFATFMYLELLDASFSFDGVIGAFAISKDIIVIAVGLGLGALYIRTLTVYLVRQGVLSEYRFLEHGAHWAIGVLAVILFVGIEHHVPEVVTGLVGALLIISAFAASVVANRRDDAELHPA